MTDFDYVLVDKVWWMTYRWKVKVDDQYREGYCMTHHRALKKGTKKFAKLYYGLMYD